MMNLDSDQTGTSLDSDKVPYRNQKKRFPWWVKSVDKITTQVDESIMEKPKRNVINWMAKNAPEAMLNAAISGLLPINHFQTENANE